MKMTFEQFDAIHPQVWTYFKRFALEAIAAGHSRFSADSILHRIRWETTVVTTGHYKVNNNFAPDYARKFMNEFPHYNHFFETRRRHNGNPQ